MPRLTAAVLVLVLSTALAARDPQERPQQADGIVRLLSDLENALSSGRVEDFRRLTAPNLTADEATARFERVTGGGLRSTAIVRERARRPDPNGVYEVIADVLVSRSREGRLATWQMSAQPARGSADRFEITSVIELAAIGDLVKLSLDSARQFQVHNFAITAPDLTLKMTSGNAFVAESDTGVTALVLRGSGEVHFTPSDPAEQGQMRLFAKRPAFIAPIDMAFLRVNPNEFTDKLTQPSLTSVKVDPEELERARQIFTDFSPRTYNLDLRSLTPERWSLEPPYGSMVVELHSKTYGWLTYARSPNEPEDISFFERSRTKNIASYASPARLAERGRFYSEDDDETYDVENYTLDVTFDPSRAWISGKTSIKLKTKVFATSSLTFRLAQSLAVSSVSSPTFGYLLSLRVVGQNSVLVSLPKLVPGGTEIVLDVVYSGRLEPQSLDREAISVEPQAQEPQGPPQGDSPILQPEPRFMYSNRIYWHPQAQVTDYATATMRLTVPSEYQIVASGVPEGSQLVPAEASTRSNPKFMRTVEYRADRPVRYLACVISRFVPVGSTKVEVPALALGDGTSASQTGASVNIEVISTPRMISRSKSLVSRVAAVTRYYAKTIGEAPYPNFTLATLDDNLPGGHSPAFFAIFHQPLPTTPYSWSDDPVAFDNIYPLFFLAHEVAHQWWGQAVGWKNYHEQWLSEGLAQYFAALYAGSDRGPDTLEALIADMRDSTIPRLSQGPISLGYRLGHIQSDGRVFRSIIYNKSAVVLHMLRRLIGDDAFFAGLRKFYKDYRFQKAGTDDLRVVFESGTSMPLGRFFDRWISGSSIPKLRLTSRVTESGDSALVKIEQVGDVFDLPLTVSVQYADGRNEDVTIKVTDATVEQSIPLKGPVRRIVAKDELSLYEIVR